MAPLAHRPQIAHAVVRRVVVEMRCSQYDAGGSHPHRINQIGPARIPAAAIAPGAAFGIEPAAIGQTPDRCEMRALAVLAQASSTREADPGANLGPVAGVTGAEGREDGHGAGRWQMLPWPDKPAQAIRAYIRSSNNRESHRINCLQRARENA
ncbi:MAG: hypothetical protein JOY71_11110 [Acetobacteraceae bacterium]|nr:hypothetical protein [Acetobacteraceae bacterium]